MLRMDCMAIFTHMTRMILQKKPTYIVELGMQITKLIIKVVISLITLFL